jgi:hypothetical protein
MVCSFASSPFLKLESKQGKNYNRVQSWIWSYWVLQNCIHTVLLETQPRLTIPVGNLISLWLCFLICKIGVKDLHLQKVCMSKPWECGKGRHSCLPHIQPCSHWFTLLFLIVLISVVLGVQCDIYKISYNLSWLNSPLHHSPLFLLPQSLVYFNTSVSSQ